MRKRRGGADCGDGGVGEVAEETGSGGGAEEEEAGRVVGLES